MLNLITLEKQEAAIKKVLDDLSGMNVKLRLDPQLLIATKTPFRTGSHGETIEINMTETNALFHAEDFLTRLAPSWPALFDIRTDYMALLISLSQIFGNTTVGQYLQVADPQTVLHFPHVEWSVERDGKTLASNNVYSFIGSEYVYSNPSLFSISSLSVASKGILFDQTVPQNDWAILTSLIKRAPPARLLNNNSKFTASTFNNADMGVTELIGRVVSVNTKLAFFYSINDRHLLLQNITLLQNRAYRVDPDALFATFDARNSILRVTNPANVQSEDLVSQVFLTDRFGYSKFSLLGIPHERTNTPVY